MSIFTDGSSQSWIEKDFYLYQLGKLQPEAFHYRVMVKFIQLLHLKKVSFSTF